MKHFCRDRVRACRCIRGDTRKKLGNPVGCTKNLRWTREGRRRGGEVRQGSSRFVKARGEELIEGISFRLGGGETLITEDESWDA